MKYKDRKISIVIFLTALLCSSCITIAGDKLKELDTIPPPSGRAIKAKFDFSYQSFDVLNKRQEYLNPDPQGRSKELHMKSALKILEETGYFSEISSKLANPDLQIKINFTHKAIFSGTYRPALYTLLLIPTWGTDEYYIDAEVANLKTGQTRSYHLEDYLDTYAQVLLLLLMPFLWSLSDYADMQQNMYDHLVVNMVNDGLLATTQVEIK